MRLSAQRGKIQGNSRPKNLVEKVKKRERERNCLKIEDFGLSCLSRKKKQPSAGKPRSVHAPLGLLSVALESISVHSRAIRDGRGNPVTFVMQGEKTYDDRM